VSNLKPNDVVEVKAVTNPHETVRLIIKAVMIIIGEKPTMEMVNGKKKPIYWTKAKTKLMANPKKFL
jgi:hypothetical protein